MSCVACLEGLEPPTPSLEGWCSIQLSYRQTGAWGHARPAILSVELGGVDTMCPWGPSDVAHEYTSTMAGASTRGGSRTIQIMLDAVRRWFTWGESLPAWQEFGAWAREHQWTLKRTITHDGWVMDHSARHPGWRIEWGPAQRSFMSSHELRIRVELAQMPDVQALVLDRPLLARLDREVYQQFTDTVQTRLDEETPEEMRWLAMHAKLNPNQMGVLLRDRYGAIGDDPEWVSRWLAGPLAQALHERSELMPVEAVSAEPFILRLARGQIVIRQSTARPRARLLDACLAVAVAAEAALKKGGAA